MTIHQTGFQAGDVVAARGREWVVLHGSTSALALRPLMGRDDESILIDPDVEISPVGSASFAPPDPEFTGSRESATLFMDSMRLSLRSGAGPFRSLGRISFEPTSYQLVPLMMALKLDVVRMLIADDVGVGKTIEAGLILREMIDRGEIDSFSVLCPPHLVDQWVKELRSKFQIEATAVSRSTAAGLERSITAAKSIFQAYPFTVVSLDYIKSDRWRGEFLRSCPDFVVVDEAHSCVGSDDGANTTVQRRYSLMQALMRRRERGLLMLTATPHSGKEGAFARLLGFIDEDFLAYTGAPGQTQLRERIAKHVVQRRRVDVKGYAGVHFPKHETTDVQFDLTPEHLDFEKALIEYGTQNFVGSNALGEWRTITLLHCSGSSPAAALRSLERRQATGEVGLNEALDLLEGDDDVEPATGAEDDPALASLIAKAKVLVASPKRDAKLQSALKAVTAMVDAGANPIVFCRYIATAHYVGEFLRSKIRNATVAVVTGEQQPEDREAAVQDLAMHDRRLMVATDCLSEGINLQGSFDAVVHYDMHWNPTRHQQREGRVDRFGQPSDVVRSLLLWGRNSAVDQSILSVIVRKVEAIRKATGVGVTIPDERKLAKVLLSKILQESRSSRQLGFDFGSDPDEAVAEVWRDAEEGEKRSRAIFAQNRLDPEDVAVEWNRTKTLLGTSSDVERFVITALRRLGGGMTPSKESYLSDLSSLPPALRDRLANAGLAGTVRVHFEGPSTARSTQVTRNHALVTVLSEYFMEASLGDATTRRSVASLARCGTWETAAVTTATTVALLRIRHRIVDTSGRVTLAEEVQALAFASGRDGPVAEGDDAMALLASPSTSGFDEYVRRRIVGKALDNVSASVVSLNEYAAKRADALEADHHRIRGASRALARESVFASKVLPVTPVDVVGVYQLLPEEAA